jgi:hypothetical protein
VGLAYAALSSGALAPGAFRGSTISIDVPFYLCGNLHLSGLFFGLIGVPCRHQATLGLQQEAVDQPEPRAARVQNGLVIVQVGLALVLVIGSGL